jgi:hypothetical protein
VDILPDEMAQLRLMFFPVSSFWEMPPPTHA